MVFILFSNTKFEIYKCVFVAEGAAVPEHCDKRERGSWIGGNKLRLSTCDSYNHSTLTHVGGNGCFVTHLIDKNIVEHVTKVMCFVSQ